MKGIPSHEQLHVDLTGSRRLSANLMVIAVRMCHPRCTTCNELHPTRQFHMTTLGVIYAPGERILCNNSEVSFGMISYVIIFRKLPSGNMLVEPNHLGAVSISTTDHPTGGRTILLWTNNMGWRSVARSVGPSCLLKQPPGVVRLGWLMEVINIDVMWTVVGGSNTGNQDHLCHAYGIVILTP